MTWLNGWMGQFFMQHFMGEDIQLYELQPANNLSEEERGEMGHNTFHCDSGNTAVAIIDRFEPQFG